MLDLEEQESQIVFPPWQVQGDLPSSPTPQQDLRAQLPNKSDEEDYPGSDDTIDGPRGPDAGEESCVSRVVETQFINLEQDSYASRVSETQFVGLEPETQATEDFTSDSLTTQRHLHQRNDRASTEIRKDNPPLPFIRPKAVEPEGLSKFKFSAASKPVPGQFTRTLGKASDITADPDSTEVSTSVPAPQPKASDVQPDQLPSKINLTVQRDEHSKRGSQAQLSPLTALRINHYATSAPHSDNLPAAAGGRVPTPQQETVTTVKLSNPKPAQRVASSNKGAKRIFRQPFPEVAQIPSSHRSHDTFSPHNNVEVEANSPNSSKGTSTPFPEAISSECRPKFDPTKGPNKSNATYHTMFTSTDPAHCQSAGASTGNHPKHPETMNFEAMHGQSLDLRDFTDVDNFATMNAANFDAYQDNENDEEILAQINLPAAGIDHSGPVQLQGIQESQSSYRSDRSKMHCPPLQPPSRPPSQSQSRPQSHRSNRGVSMIRPIMADELHAKGVSESTVLHASQQMKVKKSIGGQSHTNHDFNPHSALITEAEQRTNNGNLSTFRKFFQQAAEYVEKLGEYESKIALVESQKLQIEALQNSDRQSQVKIKALESEKEKLQKKIDRLTEIGTKYKDHFNQVAISQKWLLNHAQKLKDDKKAIMEASATYAKSESHFQKLRGMIKEAKNLRVPAIQLEELSKENEQCKAELEAEKTKNEVLHSDLDKRLLELGREKHHSEQYENQLKGQAAAHKELVEQLQKSHTAIIERLTKEDGILVKILSSGSATQTKIEEVLTVFKNVTKNEPELPLAMVKLVEDLCTRVETRLQATDTSETTLQDSAGKLFEEFEGRLNQIRLDSEAQNRLNDRIAELREANATLTADMSSKELEIQTIAKQVDGLRTDLADCRSQLTAKSDELAAIVSLRREDPQLQIKIQELESAREALCGQVDAAKQETTLAKEELRILRETAVETQSQLEEMEGKLSDAEVSIKNLIEERKIYQATFKTEIDKARQEVAKAASASKSEMIIRHEALVMSLEQRRAEAETQLKLVKDEFQRNLDERASYSSSFDKVQAELNSYKEQFRLQEAQISRLLEQNLDREEDARLAISLQGAQHEIVELRNLCEQWRSEAAQKTEAALRDREELKDKLRKVDALEQEKLLWEQQKADLQKLFDRRTPSLGYENTGHHVTQGLLSHQVEPMPSRPWQEIASYGSQIHNAATSMSLPLSRSDDNPSRFIHKDDDILRPGYRTTPMTPRQATLNERSLASGNVDNIPSRPSPFSNSTITVNTGMMALHPQMTRTPYQGALLPTAPGSVVRSQARKLSKPNTRTQPRLARRKSSNPAPLQQLRSSEQVTRTETREYKFHTLATYSGKQSSQIVDKMSANLQTPTETQPFLAMTPIESVSSSPLSDIESMIEHMGSPANEADLPATDKNLINQNSKLGEGVSNMRATALREGGPKNLAKDNAAAKLKRNETPLSHQFSDTDELPPATKVSFQTTGPSAADDSSRLRKPQTLKSALKKTGAASNKTNDQKNPAKKSSSTFESSQAASSLQDRPSARGVNQSQSRGQAKNTRFESPYHRVATGNSRESNAMSMNSGRNPRTQHQAPVRQQGISTEKSPPMMEPRRNSLKRPASSILSAEKPTKAPRMSLDRRPTSKVIPDSQETGHN